MYFTCWFSATAGGLLAPHVFGCLIDTVGYNGAWLFRGILSLLAAAFVAAVLLRFG